MARLYVIPVPIAILFLSLNRLFSRLPVQLKLTLSDTQFVLLISNELLDRILVDGL